jgi:hypothetical protein
MPGGLGCVGENEKAIGMFADQLVCDRSLKISPNAVGGQAAIYHMKRIICAAASKKDWIIGQRLADGIRPASHAEGLVFTLVVQFLPEELFEAAKIPQVLEDMQNRLLSFDLGHSPLPGQWRSPALSFLEASQLYRIQPKNAPDFRYRFGACLR